MGFWGISRAIAPGGLKLQLSRHSDLCPIRVSQRVYFLNVLRYLPLRSGFVDVPNGLRYFASPKNKIRAGPGALIYGAWRAKRNSPIPQSGPLILSSMPPPVAQRTDPLVDHPVYDNQWPPIDVMGICTSYAMGYKKGPYPHAGFGRSEAR